MIPQSSVMISAPIRDSRVEALRELLATMNNGPGLADSGNRLIPFYQFANLHMSRLLILESNVNEDIRVHGREPRPWPPTLVFLADVDGPADAFLAELAVRAGPGLEKIFVHCEGFEHGEETVLAWMQRHRVSPAANYVNWIGRTLKQVREEQALHELLRDKIDQIQADSTILAPREIHAMLQSHVAEAREKGSITLSPEPKTPLGWRIRNLAHLLLPILLLPVLLPLLVILLIPFLITLRIHERRDTEVVPRPDKDRVNRLADLEDQLVTNQFSAFGDVKPGLFRRYTIMLLLFALDYSSRHIYNKGYLTRVQTIHFARWVYLDDKRRLLFASNYDGSLESYMDDFINKVAWGLNLVFSNGIGYPRTRWLIKGGAEYEQKFKNFLRRHQLYTDVWYKAYPDLTAVDLARNTRIRRGLESEQLRDNQAIRSWLREI
jgi:hypothetical protein